MRLANLIHENREDILRLASEHGAHHVRLFGSIVRDEAGPESDIDILVEMEPQPRPADVCAARAVRADEHRGS